MKTLNVRELRQSTPKLKQTLAEEGEVLLVSNGEPIARLLPPPRKRQVASLAAHRAKMRRVDVGSELLIREERDRR